MTKFNQFFDRWNMVTVLRITAVILFVCQAGFDIVNTGVSFYNSHSTYDARGSIYNLYSTFFLMFSYFMKGLFQPAILLALAELIKIKKGNN